MRPLSIVVAFFALALLLSTKPHEATRIFHEEEWMKKHSNLLWQSLQQGSVPSSGGNPGSYIPASSRTKASTISQKGFAGHAMPPPLPPFGVATNEVYTKSTRSH
ncbi:hypothetical protein Acr_23g0019470 [Actinidia rufa]|uniref:Transmembrane protein n=1 Tax=Actinidia rufa TaxID=165716 RepID=A0A7J0GRY8_9ERIC|nr:hypothetical protein Acr_23g0019470 [Actinidia rufa]